MRRVATLHAILRLAALLTCERWAWENCMKADIAPFGASLSFLALFFGGGLDEPPPDEALGR